MKRLKQIVFAVMLSLALFGTTMSGWAAPATSCLAAVVPHYYIYVDNYTYEVTAEQYQGALSRQYDKKELVRYLREILGERLPNKFSVISGRVITTDEDIPLTVMIMRRKMLRIFLFAMAYLFPIAARRRKLPYRMELQRFPRWLFAVRR